MIRKSRSHCGRHPERLVDARRVIEREVERQRVAMAGKLFENAFDNRVKRFMLMRIVRFWRST